MSLLPFSFFMLKLVEFGLNRISVRAAMDYALLFMAFESHKNLRALLVCSCHVICIV